jgi:hypothetical protein
MRLPLITRAHHEEVVRALKDRLTACAKLLYPNGVPEEFQLLLGIHIEQAAQEAKVAEREPTEDEKAIAQMRTERSRDEAELARIKRTRPSQLGPAIARMMEKYGQRSAAAATRQSPAIALFAQAEEEALKQAN